MKLSLDGEALEGERKVSRLKKQVQMTHLTFYQFIHQVSDLHMGHCINTIIKLFISN